MFEKIIKLNIKFKFIIDLIISHFIINRFIGGMFIRFNEVTKIIILKFNFIIEN